MKKNKIRRISNGLKQSPGYSVEGKLAEFKVVPVEISNGKAAVYLVVWRNRDGEPLLLNLLPAGKWNEELMNELIVKLKQATGVEDEATMQRQLSDISKFILSLTKEQNVRNN